MFFCIYFVVALAMGHLTARLRSQQAGERRREERATALYLLTRELAQASDFADLLAIIIREVGKSARAEVALSLPGDSQEASLTPYFASTWTLSEKEQSVASWALLHKQAAGCRTDTLPSAEGLHLPLIAGQRAVGVLSLRFRDDSPTSAEQRDLLDAFVRQIALVLDRQRLRDAEQQAKLVAESEKLSKTLLDSISHEIRTPLAAITSAASSLNEARAGGQTEFRGKMADEIQEAAGRLNRLVGNLLSMTRLESGRVKPKIEWCDIADVINVTMREIEKELARHKVVLDIPAGLPLVQMDFVLMQQALANLLLNAAVHTPVGTEVRISARTEPGTVRLTVADNGPGFPGDSLPHIFEKFYRGPAAAPGGSGLGLTIVKGFVEAQEGTIQVENRSSGGAAFTISLPIRNQPPKVEEANP
jgi:two-component system sensor histidine kinase KdpD